MALEVYTVEGQQVFYVCALRGGGGLKRFFFVVVRDERRCVADGGSASAPFLRDRRRTRFRDQKRDELYRGRNRSF